MQNIAMSINVVVAVVGTFHLNWIPLELDRVWLKKAHASNLL